MNPLANRVTGNGGRATPGALDQKQRYSLYRPASVSLARILEDCCLVRTFNHDIQYVKEVLV